MVAPTLGALLLVGMVAVGATGGLVAAVLRVRTVVGFVLAAWTIGSAEVVAASLLLSLPHWLRGATLGAAIVALLTVAAAVWFVRGRPSFSGARAARRALRTALEDRVVALTAAVAVVAYAYVFTVGLAIPQLDWDAMTYHLPRAALWAQEGGVGYIADAPDARLNGMPPNAEIGVLATMLLSGSDAYVWLVQFTAAPAAGLAVAGIARRLGASREAAAFGGLAFLLFPVVFLQAPTALTDVAVVAPLAAATYFALGRSRVELALATFALALALGTKFTALLALPLLVAVLVAFHPPRRWPSLALAGAAGVVLGSYWYVLNLRRTGSIDGGIADAFDQVPDRSAGPTLDRTLTLAFRLLDLSGAEGRDRYLFPVAAAALLGAAVGLGFRRRGRRTAISFAAAAALVASTPWLLDAVHSLARRAYFKGALILERPWFPGNLRDEPGTIAGPMSSWYGPAFGVLAAACVPLVVVAVRACAVSRAALVALAAPVLFAPLVAFAVVYDPIRGRLFAFPVALAAAVFGAVLAHRALAWAGVALLTLTAALSLVHFAARPIGVSLLEPVEAEPLWRAERWRAQSAYAHPAQHDPAAFRFFGEELPPDATVAVSAAQDAYLYPIFDARGRRTVRFVGASGSVPPDAEWLLVGPRRATLQCPRARRVLATPGGWRVLRLSRGRTCDTPPAGARTPS